MLLAARLGLDIWAWKRLRLGQWRTVTERVREYPDEIVDGGD